MSESSRKTRSPLTCLAFAMLIAYVGCASTTVPSTTSNITASISTTTPTSVSSSSIASSLPTSTLSSTSSETSTQTSPASLSTPTTGSTATQATSPTLATGTVATSPATSNLTSTMNTTTNDTNSTTTTTGQSTLSVSTSPVTTTSVATNISPTVTTTPQSPQSPQSSDTTTPESTTAAVTNNTEVPTTTAPTTPAPTTRVPTTPAPTTVTPHPKSQPINPDATFQLTIDVGADKNVSCTGCNSSYVVETFTDKFKNIPGFLYIENSVASGSSISVNIRFSGSQIQALNLTDRQDRIWVALQSLNNTAGLFVLESAKEIAKAFAEKCVSLCNMKEACFLGYDCKNDYCLHKCEEKSCGDHGTCSVSISSSGEASTTCICNSDDETTYSGDNCETSKISQKKVAAIVGGVLGAFCGLFIIIIIIMCCRQRGGSSSSSKYQLGGNTNQGYSTMGMKEL